MGKIKLIHIIIALFLLLGSIMVIYLIVDMFIDHNSKLSFCYYGGLGKDIHFSMDDDCYFNSEINYNARIKEEKNKIGRLKYFLMRLKKISILRALHLLKESIYLILGNMIIEPKYF